MNILKRTASAVTALTLLAAGAALTGCSNDESSSVSVADVLSESQTEPPTEAPIMPAELPDINNFSAEPMGLLGKIKSVKMINDEVVGYIKIDHTDVDYPVFQCDNNEYYMDTDMYGDYLESGSIFMDYRDVLVPDEKKQSNNLVLYGHNMLNGSKFASLHNYRHDNSFVEEAPIIDFSTGYVNYKYAVIGYFATSGEYGESHYGEEFAYWDMENMDEKEFNDYIRIVKDRTYRDMGIDVKYGDQLITLQTCFMDEDNSRFLVIGRKLRDNEKPEDFYFENSDDEDTDKTDSDSEESSDTEE